MAAACAAVTATEQPVSTSALQQLPVLLLGYRSWTFDYLREPCESPGGRALPGPRDWIAVFRKSIPTYFQHALEDASVPEPERQAAAERFVSSYNAALDLLQEQPTCELPGYSPMQPLSTLSMCRLREECLRGAGFGDIFQRVKTEENAKALALLPGLLQELDSLAYVAPRLGLALRGVFAGNIFDLGAQASAQAYAAGGSSFGATREALLARPWAVDDMDALVGFFGAGGRYRKAVLLLDNCGPDAVLGMLPLARELIKMGTQVVLGANEVAVINDITHAELLGVLAHEAVRGDPVLGPACREGRLEALSTGSDMPVIDLRQVSLELCAACHGADLLVLQGMGRAIESNLREAFAIDSLKLGMIKHPEVAACLGARMYDCVCKWDRAAAGAGAAVGCAN